MSNSVQRAKQRQKENRKKQSYTVDVITPVYGGADFLQGLAQSLDVVDAGVPYHWIIVDDATPEDKGRDAVLMVLAALEQREHVTVVRNQVNGGFAKSNNIGASKGRAEFILMLNSDTMAIEDGWMARMVANFENPIVGAVGAKLLFFPDSQSIKRPAGKVQHAGVVFNLLGQPYHVFVGWPADHPKVNQKRVMQCVTGACLMTRRELWRHLGGLQEIYGPGNFEDVEFCIQLKPLQRVILYDPEVMLYHYAGGSDNTSTAIRNETIFQLRNRNLTEFDEWIHY